MQVFLSINTKVTWSKLNDKQRGVCGVFRSEAYIYGLNAIGLVFIGIWSEAGSRVSIHVTHCTLYPNKYQNSVIQFTPPGRQNIWIFDRVSGFLQIDATFYLRVTKLIVLQQLWLSQTN